MLQSWKPDRVPKHVFVLLCQHWPELFGIGLPLPEVSIDRQHALPTAANHMQVNQIVARPASRLVPVRIYRAGAETDIVLFPRDPLPMLWPNIWIGARAQIASSASSWSMNQSGGW